MTMKHCCSFFTLIISLFFAVFSFGGCNFTFSTKYDNELTFVLDESTNSYSVASKQNCGGDLVIPETYNDLPVRKIEPYAFYQNALTSVVIPDSIDIIGSAAFAHNEKLSNVTLPSNLQCLEESMFADCPALSTITLPESLKEIESAIFEWCTSLQSLRIPQFVNKIGTDIFNGCTALETITVDDANEYYYAKDNCLMERETKTLIAGCKTSKIPTETKKIAEWSFSNMTGLENISLPNGLTEIDRYAFAWCRNLKNFVLPNTIQSLAEGAFYWCESVTEVTFPQALTFIGPGSFWGTGLKVVTIPKTLVNVGKTAFAYCHNLTEFKVAENHPNYKSVNGHLYTKGGEILIQYALGKTDNSFTIPEGVLTVNERAFAGETDLLHITVSKSVVYIECFAFSCENLKTVKFIDPYGWESILDDLDLTNEKKAATLLRELYTNHAWQKTPE